MKSLLETKKYIAELRAMIEGAQEEIDEEREAVRDSIKQGCRDHHHGITHGTSLSTYEMCEWCQNMVLDMVINLTQENEQLINLLNSKQPNPCKEQHVHDSL